MKEFISALKKHGRSVRDNIKGCDPCLRHWDTGHTLVPFYVDEDGEQPELMCACLDEIERLGYRPSLMMHGEHGSRWVVNWSTDGSVECGLSGATKTEACRNALTAVLEAE